MRDILRPHENDNAATVFPDFKHLHVCAVSQHICEMIESGKTHNSELRRQAETPTVFGPLFTYGCG